MQLELDVPSPPLAAHVLLVISNNAQHVNYQCRFWKFESRATSLFQTEDSASSLLAGKSAASEDFLQYVTGHSASEDCSG